MPARFFTILGIGLLALQTQLSACHASKQSSSQSSTAPGSAPQDSAPAPMGSWQDWQDLSPLVDLAKVHLGPEAYAPIVNAQKSIQTGDMPAADQLLSQKTHGSATRWLTVARANLAALHFRVCIRGVAWRMEKIDPKNPSAHPRSFDFSPGRKLSKNDVSVEALLTNLDEALEKSPPQSILAVQARIARARMTAFVSQCPPNNDVAQRANGILRTDLATLAANSHLTPDLAYVWAGIQMNEFSGSAAKPFLRAAKAGGFEGPAVDYLLAVVALDEGRYEDADLLAQSCMKAFEQQKDLEQLAQTWFLRGEIATHAKKPKDAEQHYQAALEVRPDHLPATISLLRLKVENTSPLDGQHWLSKRLPILLEGDKGNDAKSEFETDQKWRELAELLDALVAMVSEDIQLAEVLRNAFLDRVDLEPAAMIRGLRYFYAATLDVRLGDLQSAQGHALTAETEFEEASEASGAPPPINVRQFLDRVRELGS